MTTLQEPRRMAGNTPKRNIRVPDDLWDAVKTAADDRGDNLSAVIRELLADYAAGNRPGYQHGYRAGQRALSARIREALRDTDQP